MNVTPQGSFQMGSNMGQMQNYQQPQQQQNLQLQPQSLSLSNVTTSQMSTPRMEQQQQQSSAETVSESKWHYWSFVQIDYIFRLV